MLVVVAIGPTAAQPPDNAVAQAADTASVWRTFASRIEVGAPIKVSLGTGQTFKATLVDARPDVLLVQPKTRVAVPVQPIAYDAIVSIERERPGGIGGGKAALIGVASGAATFFGILFIMLAAIDD